MLDVLVRNGDREGFDLHTGDRLTDDSQFELAERLASARTRSDARRVMLARIPTVGMSMVMGTGSIISLGLFGVLGAPFSPVVPLVLAVASLATWYASKWVEHRPGVAGEAGNVITALATLVLMPFADGEITIPIGVAATALVTAGGTMSARPGAWHWIPAGMVSWWIVLLIHPPQMINLVPAVIFPALLIAGTGLMVRQMMRGLADHDLLNRDALAGLLAVSEELERQRERAYQANQAKSAFLTNMSHELRTPLNAIIGYSELILEDPDDVDPQDVERIQRSGKHLLELVNDVLDMSRIEAGALEVREDDIELLPLLDELREMTLGLTESNGLGLDWTIDDDVPATIPGDGLRVRQVLINLIGNAVKFTGSGTIGLHAACEDDRLVIEVSDTGPGIPDEMQEQLFVPFIQGADEGMKHQGSGLGLPIAQRLARAMHGDIWVSSELGIGSTFTLELPLTVDAIRDRIRDSGPPWATS